MINSILGYLKLLLIAAVSLFLIYASMLKLVSYPGMKESFYVWGYGSTEMYIVGFVELLLAVLIFFPKTRVLGAIGVIVLMTGALYTHIVNIEYDQLASGIFLTSASLAIVALELLLNKKL